MSRFYLNPHIFFISNLIPWLGTGYSLHLGYSFFSSMFFFFFLWAIFRPVAAAIYYGQKGFAISFGVISSLFLIISFYSYLKAGTDTQGLVGITSVLAAFVYWFVGLVYESETKSEHEDKKDAE